VDVAQRGIEGGRERREKHATIEVALATARGTCEPERDGGLGRREPGRRGCTLRSCARSTWLRSG
jgi:hypothetical protein